MWVTLLLASRAPRRRMLSMGCSEPGRPLRARRRPAGGAPRPAAAGHRCRHGRLVGRQHAELFAARPDAVLVAVVGSDPGRTAARRPMAPGRTSTLTRCSTRTPWAGVGVSAQRGSLRRDAAAAADRDTPTAGDAHRVLAGSGRPTARRGRRQRRLRRHQPQPPLRPAGPARRRGDRMRRPRPPDLRDLALRRRVRQQPPPARKPHRDPMPRAWTCPSTYAVPSTPS